MKIYHILINKQVVYVGKTNNPKRRISQHKTLLACGRHRNKYLQDKYNQYETFELVVVQENATDRDEQMHIAAQHTQQRNNRVAPNIAELRAIHRRVFS